MQDPEPGASRRALMRAAALAAVAGSAGGPLGTPSPAFGKAAPSPFPNHPRWWAASASRTTCSSSARSCVAGCRSSTTARCAGAREVLDEMQVHIPSVDLECERLSGSQRQAIAVARAVNSNARILLLDEPLGAMGAREAGLILDLIARLRPGVISRSP